MYGSDWTAQRVHERLAQAYIAGHGRPIHKTAHAPTPRNPDGIDLIIVTSAVLDHDASTWLLHRARCAADGGLSEFCRDMGWSRRTLYDRTDRAAARVAAYLNGRPIDTRTNEPATSDDRSSPEAA